MSDRVAGSPHVSFSFSYRAVLLECNLVALHSTFSAFHIHSRGERINETAFLFARLLYE